MSDELKTPGDGFFKKMEKICLHNNPYDAQFFEDGPFMEAMKESIQWHCEKSEYYRKLLDQEGFDPQGNFKLEEIPFIFANFFKHHEVKSISDEEVTLHLTSSGTTGQKSQIFFDEWSIRVAQRMVEKIWEYYGWRSDEKCNYLLYTYEPQEGSKLGTAFTDNYLCDYAPINKVHYALKYSGKDGHKFDLFGTIKALQEFEKEGLPVRIFGFPSFFHFTLQKMRELEVAPLNLHPASMTFFGGGWKGHQNKAISKFDLYREAEEQLGIPYERCRDGFGSVEHCVPYIECAHHQFHIPVYSRVLIRDVKNLRPLPNGKVGYLNFISPFITSVPANNVLMGDLAILHDGSSCPCDVETPYFEIVGRAGLSSSKSCAIAASELLGEHS